jgi:hypothetical protein
MLTLCGGTPEVFERGKQIYSTFFCKDIVHLGDIGAGQFGKAMNNFLLWVNGVALIEAGRLSEATGMDLVKLRDALLMSSGASDALKNWENVSFLWALKDMQIVAKIADKAGLAMPIAGAIKELVKDGRRIKQTNPPDWTVRGASRSPLTRRLEGHSLNRSRTSSCGANLILRSMSSVPKPHRPGGEPRSVALRQSTNSRPFFAAQSPQPSLAPWTARRIWLHWYSRAEQRWRFGPAAQWRAALIRAASPARTAFPVL